MAIYVFISEMEVSFVILKTPIILLQLYFNYFAATSWNTCSSHRLSIGTVSSPVTKLLNVNGKLWCSIQGIIKVLDTESFSVWKQDPSACTLSIYVIEIFQVINQIQISSDSKPITNMTVANNLVWISIQNSAHIKCFHSNT